MNNEIYFGNIKECCYEGYAGNYFGVSHNKMVKEDLYFIKLEDGLYIELNELMSNKKKKTFYKDYALRKGDLFVSDLVCINDLVNENIISKKLK